MSLWTPWNVQRVYPVADPRDLDHAGRIERCEVCGELILATEGTDVRRALAEIRDDELADCRQAGPPGRICETCARRITGCTEVAYWA